MTGRTSTGSVGSGLAIALLSAATFATAGPFAKSLLETGWTPGSVVLLRIGGAALVLAVPAARALRGRWALLARRWRQLAAYGAAAVAVPQLFFFYAVQHLSVGVALLLEYLALVLVVVWTAVVARRLPPAATNVGVVLAIVGLFLVLDVLGGVRIDGLGVLFGLIAACGLASYFLLSERVDDDPLPPIVLAAGGLTAAALTFAVLGALRVLPMSFPATSVRIGGSTFPWWVAVVELAAIAAALAYVTGIAAVRRLGATLSSFVGLFEVVFAVLFSWVLLGELPRPVQLVGGVFILSGVVVVRAAGPRVGSEAEARPFAVSPPLGEAPVVADNEVEGGAVDVATGQDEVAVVGPAQAQSPVTTSRTT